MLRAMQCGFSVIDLEIIELGLVLDCLTELANDQFEYDYIATQDDIDRL